MAIPPYDRDSDPPIACLLHEPWAPTKPDMPVPYLESVAGEPDAVERATIGCGNIFDAAADGVLASEDLEEAERKNATAEESQLYYLEKARNAEPQVRSATLAASFGKPDGGTVFSRGLAVVSGIIMLMLIPFVAALGIAESFVFEPVSDDWRLGLPFGLPVLGGIIASGLLRHTLGHRARDLYDRIVSVGAILALAVWAASYAYTFLSPVDLSGASIAAELGFSDLRLFYAAHLCLEITAGMGLAAMAERGFAAGRKVISVVNDTLEFLTTRFDVVVERRKARLYAAEVIKDRRKRLAAARAAFIEECLGYLAKVQARRRAAIALAEAGLTDITTKT